MNKKIAWMMVAGLMLVGAAAHAATQFSAADYDLYPGDFDGDGKSDLLYISKTPDKPSGIALADAGGNPQLGFQSWPSNYLNIPWSNGVYIAVVADFDNDGRADILLQRTTPGNSYVLLSNSNPDYGPYGRILGISESIPQDAFHIGWSADQHKIIAGNFDGVGGADLFFQSTTPAGANAIVLSSANGPFDWVNGGSGTCLLTQQQAHGPQQCWTDGYKGFNWSSKASVVYAANFGGDGKADLLILAKPNFVVIDYDVSFPVPTFKPQSFGILLAQTDNGSGIFRTLDDAWNHGDRGIEWSPLNTTLVIGDFNGDLKADIFAQSKSGGRSGKVLFESASGTGVVQSATAVASNIGSYAANSSKLMAGYFGGSTSAVLYAQAITSAGSNFYTGNISAGGGSTFASSMQIAPSLPAPVTVVGATAGTASVSTTGVAGYSIGIDVPSGTAGLTPKLAIQYQHSAGNGLLGVGWGLAGLSVITRCPMTIAQDAVTQGVQRVQADQYCLDGNRLLNVGGTAQGSDGSQYRTELETYSKIVAHGASGTGPVWFEVWTKDGLVYEYGNSTDSRVAITGTGITRVWALSKTRDRASNYVSFSYFNNNLNASCQETTVLGAYHICQIQYTGNSDQAVSPPYTIQFIYEGRNSGETLVHYYGGGVVQEFKRLKRIELKYAGSVVHDYRITYRDPIAFAPVSRISLVQECGAAGGCLKETTFGWSDVPLAGGAPAVSPTETWERAYGIGPGYQSAPLSADLNGDGVPDSIVNYTITGFPQTCIMQVFYGTAHGQTLPGPVTVPGYTCNHGALMGVMDVDADGKDDVLFYSNYYLHQRADGSLALDSAGTGGSVPQVLVDVDGDGQRDLVWIGAAPDNNKIFVRLHNRGSAGFVAGTSVAWTAPAGTTITSNGWLDANLAVHTRSNLTGADIDGDGRQDILVQVNNGWRVLYSNGFGFDLGEQIISKYDSSRATYVVPTFIDVNGDGCTDLAYPDNTPSPAWQLAISRCAVIGGAGLNAAFSTQIADPMWSGLTQYTSVVDLNMDGNQDLIFATSSTPSMSIAYSLGTTLAPAAAIGGSYWQDRDGDGVPDQIATCVSACGTPPPSLTYGLHVASGPRPDLLTSAEDGFGNRVRFIYAPLTDPSVYTRGTGATGVDQDFTSPMLVVKRMESTDGAGGTYATTYAYQQARRNVQGRGFLGFAKRTIADSRTGATTEENYDQSNWARSGRLVDAIVRQSGGQIIQRVQNTWLLGTPSGSPSGLYPYLRQKIVLDYELTGSLIRTTSTTTTIDGYGTPYEISTTITESGTGLTTGLNPGSSATWQAVTPTAQIINNTATWCLSRVKEIQSVRSHTLTDGGGITRARTQAWDESQCRLTDQVEAPGSGLQLSTHVDYDNFNNVWKTTVSGDGIVGSRVTETKYYSDGHFLEYRKNAKLQTTSYTWDSARGLMQTETVVDTNNRTTTWIYDPNFSRIVRVIRPDQTSTRYSYAFCNSNNSYCGDSLLRMMTEIDEQNVSDAQVSYSRVYVDSLGRPKYEQKLGLSGALSTVQTMYDNMGWVASRSVPYFAGSDPYRGSSFTYDLLGRMVETLRPVSDADQSLQSERVVYNGLTVTRIDALNGAQTQVSNAWGQIVRAIDGATQPTNYTYNSFGELKSTTDPAGNVTLLTYYDARGLKHYSDDPDMGHWQYTYDGLGAMLTQTDAKGQTTTFQYDALGRVSKRWDHPGTASEETDWNWDTSSNGVGQLGSVTSPGGYSETYTYDSLGRRGGLTTVAGSQGTFQIDYGYDPSLGTLSTITYPTSFNGGVSSRYSVRYGYQNGHLKDVRDASNSGLLWQADALDARGNLIQESYGNGQSTYANFDETNGRLNYIQTGTSSGGSATQSLFYQWDRVGNLLSRRDANQSSMESFGYDAVYRLTSTQVSGSIGVTMTYDAIGNLTSKSDVGSTLHSYNYSTPQAGCSYAGLTSQPHAVRNAGGTPYCYDKNGNMVSRGGATVTWSTYDYPLTFNQAGGKSSTFYYGADRSRYRQTRVDGSTTEEVIYIAGLFEKTTSGGTTEYRHTVLAGGEAVAIVLRSTIPANSNVLYLHTDHLGSTDVISKASGAPFKTAFDAWGNRRGDKTGASTTTHRGFTGQEQLDNLNLVHLNGRVYDPVIGRFLSADPIVQDPYHSQSFNRYAYVWNNPLNATDPTGFCQITGSRIEYDVCMDREGNITGGFWMERSQAGVRLAQVSAAASDAGVKSAQEASGATGVSDQQPAGGDPDFERKVDVVRGDLKLDASLLNSNQLTIQTQGRLTTLTVRQKVADSRAPSKDARVSVERAVKEINETWSAEYTAESGRTYRISVQLTVAAAGEPFDIRLGTLKHGAAGFTPFGEHAMYMSDGAFAYVFAHEFGHILGLNDRYDIGHVPWTDIYFNRGAQKGFSNDIMGQALARPTPPTIYALIDTYQRVTSGAAGAGR